MDHGTSRRALAAASLLSLLACGAGRVVDAPAPAADAPVAGSTAEVTKLEDDTRDAAKDAAKDPWSVRITAGGATSVASWPALEHAWSTDAPDAVTAEGTVCLPRGRYIFEESSSPSLDMVLLVDGREVIRQHDFPTELSRPLVVDGCVAVRADLRNPLRFRGISFRVRVRPAAPELPACEDTYPRGQWHACLYAGRNQEEHLGVEAWPALAVPKDQRPGVNGQFDWMSIVARQTVCFAKGNYVFHSTSSDTLRVFVGDALVIDAPSTRSTPVMESRPTRLSGCLPVRVEHTYRFGLSTLELAWATVGSAEDRAWSVERACGFACDETSRCTRGDTLAPEVKGRHLCVPFERPSRDGEYCDARHPCAGSLCVRAFCRPD